MNKERLLQLAGVTKNITNLVSPSVLGERVILNEGDKHKAGVVVRLEKDTEGNDNFRKVLFTTPLSQLVLMSLKPGEEIGMEVHNGDQFIRIDKGEALSELDGVKKQMNDGDAVVIPKGTKHNITNTSKTDDLKIYAVYSPPQHKDGQIDKTKPAKDSDDL